MTDYTALLADLAAQRDKITIAYQTVDAAFQALTSLNNGNGSAAPPETRTEATSGNGGTSWLTTASPAQRRAVARKGGKARWKLGTGHKRCPSCRSTNPSNVRNCVSCLRRFTFKREKVRA